MPVAGVGRLKVVPEGPGGERALGHVEMARHRGVTAGERECLAATWPPIPLLLLPPLPPPPLRLMPPLRLLLLLLPPRSTQMSDAQLKGA